METDTALSELFASVDRGATVSVRRVTICRIKDIKNGRCNESRRVFEDSPANDQDLNGSGNVRQVAKAIDLSFAREDNLQDYSVAQASAVALSIVFTVFKDSVTDRRLRAAFNNDVDQCNLATRFTRRETSVSSLSISFLSRKEGGYFESSGQAIRISVSRLTRFNDHRFRRQSAFSSANIIRRGVSCTCLLFSLYGRDVRLLFVHRITGVAIDFSAFDFVNDRALVRRFLFSVIGRSDDANFDRHDHGHGPSAMEDAYCGYGLAFR